MHTNAYKGEGGSELDKSTHFVRMFIENVTIFNHLRRTTGGKGHVGSVVLCWGLLCAF